MQIKFNDRVRLLSYFNKFKLYPPTPEFDILFLRSAKHLEKCLNYLRVELGAAVFF